MGNCYYFVCKDEWLRDGEVNEIVASESGKPVFKTWCFVDECASCPYPFTEEINRFLFCLPEDVTVFPDGKKIDGDDYMWIAKELWNTLTAGMVEYIMFECERLEHSPYLDVVGLKRWLDAHIGKEVKLMSMRCTALCDCKFHDDPLRIGPIDKKKEF